MKTSYLPLESLTQFLLRSWITRGALIAIVGGVAGYLLYCGACARASAGDRYDHNLYNRYHYAQGEVAVCNAYHDRLNDTQLGESGSQKYDTWVPCTISHPSVNIVGYTVVYDAPNVGKGVTAEFNIKDIRRP